MLDYDFRWSIIWQYREILGAALLFSLELAAAALVIGGLLGVGLAYLATAPSRILRTAAKAYVDVVRNTPLLLFVLIMFLVVPELGIRGLAADVTFIAALSVVASGHIAENLRAALGSMPKAYVEAGKAIGLTAWQRQVHVVMPIVLRYALPALTNSAVAIFKDTSNASIIAIRELTFVAREISTNYFRVFEAWITVGAIYLAITALMTLLSRRLERRLSKLG